MISASFYKNCLYIHQTKTLFLLLYYSHFYARLAQEISNRMQCVSCFINKMPNHICCVAGCNNKSRKSENNIIRSHIKENVNDVKFLYFPKDLAKRQTWIEQVGRGVVDFSPSSSSVVCSNHIEYGKPKFLSPIPTMYMTLGASTTKSPMKRRRLSYHEHFYWA